MIARTVMGCCIVATLILSVAHNSRAQTSACDWQKAFAMLKADKRFGEPITATDKTAQQLTAVANLNVSNQAMIVPVFGPTPEQLKFVVLGCGPNETWTPRHFIIDAEAERRFYDLAPPPPSADVDDLPKPPKRTRKAKQ